MLTLIALSTAAWAHLPHDLVVALAAPATLDDSAPWTVVARPGAVDLLLRSDDGGHSWRFVGGPPTVDVLLDAAVADQLTVLLGEDRAWWTEDGGEWTQQDLGAGWTLVEADSAGLYIAGEAGLAHLDPSGITVELTHPIHHLASSTQGLIAVGDGIWVHDDAWTPILDVPADATSAIVGDQVYVGTAGGEVWRHDGNAWTACGSLPDTEGLPEVRALAWADGTLLAAPAGLAPLVSQDGCATWELRQGLYTLYDAQGGASGPDQAITVLRASGSKIAIGGWAGLARSEDLGQQWTDAPLLPADGMRGLALSPRFADDGTVWVGGLTSGVLRSTDGGRSFSAPSLGLDATNVQEVSVHPSDPGRLVAVVGHEAWLSGDGGLRWRPMSPPFDYVQTASVFDRGVWALGQDGEVAWKGWRRPAWWSPPLPEQGGRLSQVVLDGDVTKCLSARADGVVRCLSQDLSDWAVLLDAGAARMTPVVQDGDTTLVVGHGPQLLRRTQAGQWSEELALVDDEVHALVSVHDNDALWERTLLAGTRTGRLLLSEADGSWRDLGLALPAAPEVIVARPDFASRPQLVIGTWAGAWLLDLETETLSPFARVQWIDDNSSGFDLEGETEAAAGAAFGRVTVLEDGKALSVAVRGSRVSVRGQLPLGAVLEVDVYDPAGPLRASATRTLSSDGVEELIALDDLPDTWHRVVVRGVGGLRFDGVVGEGAAVSLDRATPASSQAGCSGCHVGTVPGGWRWLSLPLLLAVVGKRRRA